MRQDLASARRDRSNTKKNKPKRPFGKGLQRERGRKREKECLSKRKYIQTYKKAVKVEEENRKRENKLIFIFIN